MDILTVKLIMYTFTCHVILKFDKQENALGRVVSLQLLTDSMRSNNLIKKFELINNFIIPVNK